MNKDLSTNIKANAYGILILVAINIISVIVNIVNPTGSMAISADLGASTGMIVALIIIAVIYCLLQVCVALGYIKNANGVLKGKGHMTLTWVLFIISLINVVFVWVNYFRGTPVQNGIHDYFAILEVFMYGEFLFYNKRIVAALSGDNAEQE